MSEKLDKLVGMAAELQDKLERFEKEYDQMIDSTDRYPLSADEVYQYNTLYLVNDKLSDAFRSIKAMKAPVRREGFLTKNSGNRYEVDGWELSSGSPVEIWEDDEELKEGGFYTATRIEHNGTDYYVVALGRDISINGLKARIKTL
ncbi:DUF5348 domain-containing protein [Metabacillus litoralis]|uniref:DUF5348 domain-containing protein n=1 Tax=Metabacillus litoralis TaxID=152268 RepID=UPI00203B04FC|nr:DUF5348 domain-containing protein [Metabacillus litoralis]MCM3413214.1 DUF5348 domain-containing protein [Metabacillus litoralis]